MRPGDPRRLRLAHLNALVYALLAVLVAAFWPELRWAARGLPLYLRGGFPPLVERERAAEAGRLAMRGESQRALALVAQAVAIDPNSFAFLQGEIERRAGNPQRALECYRRAIAIDPSDAPAYLRAAGLLREQGREAEARALLRDGIAYLSSQVHLYRPQPDPQVPEAFNRKAEEVYRSYDRSLRELRAAVHVAPARGPGA